MYLIKSIINHLITILLFFTLLPTITFSLTLEEYINNLDTSFYDGTINITSFKEKMIDTKTLEFINEYDKLCRSYNLYVTFKPLVEEYCIQEISNIQTLDCFTEQVKECLNNED